MDKKSRRKCEEHLQKVIIVRSEPHFSFVIIKVNQLSLFQHSLQAVYLFFLSIRSNNLLLQSFDVDDDLRDRAMVFHHFLVMTAALVGRPALDQSAHHDIYLQNFTTLSILVEKLGIFYQKLLVSCVLGESPKGDVKLACFDAFLPVFDPQFILFGVPVGPVNFFRAGHGKLILLPRERGVCGRPVYRQFGHLMQRGSCFKNYYQELQQMVFVECHKKWQNRMGYHRWRREHFSLVWLAQRVERRGFEASLFGQSFKQHILSRFTVFLYITSPKIIQGRGHRSLSVKDALL